MQYCAADAGSLAVFNVKDYGAVGDGEKLDSPAINSAIEACNEAGGGTVHLFVEPLLLAPTLVVIGCGHVGKAVAELAKWLDFRVVVADDRAGYATPEQMPGMDAYVEAPPAELVARLNVTPRTYVVAVTRGVDIDRDFLPALLATETPYIGLIGSRRRWTATAEILAALGIKDLSRVHTPVGLELNAETPKEIALSILAEVVMIMRGAAKTPERHP